MRPQLFLTCIVFSLAAASCASYTGRPPIRTSVITSTPPFVVKITPPRGIPDHIDSSEHEIPCGKVTFYKMSDAYGYIVNLASETELDPDCIDEILKLAHEWKPVWEPEVPVLKFVVEGHELTPISPQQQGEEFINLPPGGFILTGP